MLFFKDGGNYWRSIANRYGASGGLTEVGVGVNISSEWRSNEWHHAAFTWTTQSLKLYIDGRLRTQASIGALPLVNAATLQLGADNTSSYLNTVIDELRVSNRERTAAEIEQSLLANLTVMGLAVQPATTNLLVTWWHSPSMTATTTVGVVQVPSSAASWTSSNPDVATIDPAGTVIARAAGTALLTATVHGASATLTVSVSAPIRPAEVDAIDPGLATPAAGALYDMPVIAIHYIPTRDGVSVDPAILGTSTITTSIWRTRTITWPARSPPVFGSVKQPRSLAFQARSRAMTFAICSVASAPIDPGGWFITPVQRIGVPVGI